MASRVLKYIYAGSIVGRKRIFFVLTRNKRPNNGLGRYKYFIQETCGNKKMKIEKRNIVILLQFNVDCNKDVVRFYIHNHFCNFV